MLPNLYLLTYIVVDSSQGKKQKFRTRLMHANPRHRPPSQRRPSIRAYEVARSRRTGALTIERLDIGFDQGEGDELSGNVKRAEVHCGGNCCRLGGDHQRQDNQRQRAGGENEPSAPSQ